MPGQPNPIYEADYLGGATPFVGDLNTHKQNVALSFIGFDSGDATVEVLAIGATDWAEITLDTPGTTMRVLQTPLTQFRVSGLVAAPTGTYKITAFQW